MNAFSLNVVNEFLHPWKADSLISVNSIDKFNELLSSEHS